MEKSSRITWWVNTRITGYMYAKWVTSGGVSSMLLQVFEWFYLNISGKSLNTENTAKCFCFFTVTVSDKKLCSNANTEACWTSKRC